MLSRGVLTLSLILLWSAASCPAWAAAPPTLAQPEVPMAHSLTDYRQAVRSGGPGKDGIPAIDRPHFESVAEADTWLEPGDRVIGLYRDGEARAYPQRILVWHEIVNDVVAGEPLSVTYCPLTGSALGFRRGDSSFGVSGRLVNSNLVMYDRATDSEWPQLLSVAIEGPLAGRGLLAEQLIWTTWGAWKARHPETRVLSRDTGYVRNYRSDPYGGYNPVSGYYRPDSRALFPVMARDDRLPPKAMVLAFHDADAAAAIRLPVLREAGVLPLTLDERTYVILHDPGLDTGWVYRNPEGRTIDHASLTFGPSGVSGPGMDTLEPVSAFQVMWFAWAGFHPDSVLIGEGVIP